MLTFLLGLSHVMRGPRIDAARGLHAPVLVSSNALSAWKKDASGVPVWHGFRTTNLHHLNGLEAYLNSATAEEIAGKLQLVRSSVVA